MWGTAKKEKERSNQERSNRKNRQSERKYHGDSYSESTPRGSGSQQDERSSMNDVSYRHYDQTASTTSNRAHHDNSDLEERFSRARIDSPEPNYTTNQQDQYAATSSTADTRYTDTTYQYATISSSPVPQYAASSDRITPPVVPSTYPQTYPGTSAYQYSSHSPVQSSSSRAYTSSSQQARQAPIFSARYPQIGGGPTYPSGEQSSDPTSSYGAESASNYPQISSSTDTTAYEYPQASASGSQQSSPRGYSTTTASSSMPYTVASSSYSYPPSYGRGNIQGDSSGTVQYTTTQSYGQNTAVQSSSLTPITLPDPIDPPCKCELGHDNLCGVIIWPRPAKPKDGKVRSSRKGESSSSKPSSITSYKFREIKSRGSDGQNCGPLVLPGITPYPEPDRGERDYDLRKEKWDNDFKEWRDISCPCGYGYFDIHGLWISGGEVRLWLKGGYPGQGKPGNPLWRDNEYRAPKKSKHNREESKRKIYERNKED